jgi:hypothetical protein
VDISTSEAIANLLNKNPLTAEDACVGFRAICDLVATNPESKAGFTAVRGCEALLTALKAHLDNPDAAEEGCAAVLELADDTETRNILGSLGACECITSVLTVHASNQATASTSTKASVRVVAKACWAISDLCYEHPENRSRLGACGAREKVIAALNTHVRDPSVAQYACAALCNMSLNHHENKKSIGAHRGCEAVVAAIEMHRNNAAVVIDGCAAMISLATNSAHNRTSLGAIGGCEAVVHVLRTLISNVPVVDRALDVILNLSNFPSNQLKFGDCGACDAVVDVLTTHISNPATCEKACWAICKLSFNNMENQMRFSGNGGCEAIVLAAKTHSSDPGMCNQFCWCVCALAINLEIRQYLIDLGAKELALGVLKNRTFVKYPDILHEAHEAVEALTDESLSAAFLIKLSGKNEL